MQPNRNEEVALLALLSGDKPLEKVGSAVLSSEQQKRALAQRDQHFQAREDAPIHLGNGFIYDPKTGKAHQHPNYAKYADTEHERRLEFAAAQNAQRQERLTGTERAKLANLDSQLQLGRDALAMLEQNPEAVEPFADTATNVVKGVWPDMGNLIESSHKTPAELDTLNKARRFIASIRKSELGSALTGYELQKGAEWDPTAGGISSKEASRRLNNLIQYLEQEYELYRAGRPLTHEQDKQAAPAPRPQPQADQVWEIQDGKPVRVR